MVDYEKYFGGVEETASYYDEIDITEFRYYPEQQMFTYPCPCGDMFLISLQELENGETIATCPSCSLIVLVIYEETDILKARNASAR